MLYFSLAMDVSNFHDITHILRFLILRVDSNLTVMKIKLEVMKTIKDCKTLFTTT
jgi:hypothetical protein